MLPAFDPGIDADVLASRCGVAGDETDRRHKPTPRVLGADPHLHRPALQGHLLLGKGQRLARGNAQLQLDQIEPVDQLGDRMLDLQAGIHFQKKKLALFVEDELHRAGIDIAGLSRQLAGKPPHSFAQAGSRAQEGDSSMIFW